jgi:hypothetical protein
VVVEADAAPALPRDADVSWMNAVGLDRSVPRRGLSVMPSTTADRLIGTAGLRVLKPLGPRLKETR